MLSRSIAFAKALSLQWPVIIQAPMAGGITTPELVASIAENGALGSFATGYLKKNDIIKGITDIKTLTDKPFAVNVFVPNSGLNPTETPSQDYMRIINKFRARVGLSEIEFPNNNSFFEEELEETINILIEQKIRVVSFAFGLPSTDIINKLKRNGMYLCGTANSLEEAILLNKNGFDAIIAQSYEAGGHRGGFLTKPAHASMGAVSLIPQISESIDCPVIASGGIMDGRGVMASLILGASAVQLGTAFLAVKESGASNKYKDELDKAKKQDCDITTLTNAYTGKFARGMRTEFAEEIDANVKIVPEYPIAHHLSAQLRKKSSEVGYREAMSMWCGQSVYGIRTHLKANELIQAIRKEFYSCLEELSFQKNFLEKERAK